jgi:NAD(P)-dependent dehydrogenase (short-subunit alcohol dehydrogenase family)
MRFRKKVVLITGAGVGIGRAAAVQFGREGAKVAINSLTPRNGEETLRLVKETGAEAIYIQGDVSIAADAARMVAETVRAFGRIDVLVNNAGVVLPGRVDNLSEEDWDKTMAVNLKGVFLVSKYAIPEMRRVGGGVIVHNASVAATKGLKDRGAYSASKGGVLALTKAMAADYLGENIRVNCVCPGTTYTPSLERRIQAFPDPEKARKEFIARQPMGRLGRLVATWSNTICSVVRSQLDKHIFQMVIPPSIAIAAPFMKAASSEAANKMAAAISSSFPRRPIG